MQDELKILLLVVHFDSYCQRCLLVEDHPGRLVEASQYLEQQLAIYEQPHLQQRICINNEIHINNDLTI